MSSEDVIELGSSDEETREPAPKKSKPLPNAMVCFPSVSKFREVTIKPAKPSSPKLFSRMERDNRNVINAKLPIHLNNKLKGNPVSAVRMKPKLACNPYTEQKKHLINPISTLNNAISVKKMPFPKNILPKIQSLSTPQTLKRPIRIQNASKINLPSGITVKRTVPSIPMVKQNVRNKTLTPVDQKMASANVLTVDLDDDETTAPSSNSKQWYIRPEDQSEASILEEENNKEPNTAKLIEIIIEDSPVKRVASQSAILIEDSPNKEVADKQNIISGSENEEESASNEEPQSKKKLEYTEEVESNKTIEIEISNDNKNIDKVEELNAISEHVTDHVKSNGNTKEEITSETSNIKKTEDENDNLGEFHPVYQSFINLCFELENSDDMQKIVEKKIKGYYRQVSKEYTESEEFIDLVSSKILSMKAGPQNMFLYIKDIVDELNMQRKIAKSKPILKETKTEEPTELSEDSRKYDSKRERQIRRLEKTIKKLSRAIQKLEEQEVDFDDDDDSVYLLTERYKERMVRVYAKFCQLSNTKMPSEPRIVIDTRPGQPIGPAKRLEKWINRKVPIGTPLPFPDFHDVLRCVREANEEDKLGFNEVDIMEEARDLFVRCGKKLKRRRQENEWRLAASRITLDADPAVNSSELQKKLNENKKVAAQKEIEVFNKFADRQNQLKLEAEEIGDKEAEESPVESEEEEDMKDQSISLENTEKRKERLKRLIQEQSKKSNEEKEIQIPNKDQNDEKPDEEMEVSISIQEENVAEKEVVSETTSIVDIKVNETETVPNKRESSENVEFEKASKEESDDNVVQIKNQEKESPTATETLTLSDDSSELESDMDELHLLQKLHKTNADESSTVDTSDSESPIAISDSLESSDDVGNVLDDDVISIENSSYSEDEIESVENIQQEKSDSGELTTKDTLNLESKIMSATDDNAMDIEYSTAIVSEVSDNTNNYQDKTSIEDVLFVSAEEDNCRSVDKTCFNLKDDLISIEETVISVCKETDIPIDNTSTTTLDERRTIRDDRSNEIPTDDLTINSIELNCESPQETDIPEDNITSTKYKENNIKNIRVEVNTDGKVIPADDLTSNSVESNCENVEETKIVADDHSTAKRDESKDVKENTLMNKMPKDDLRANCMESNYKSSEDTDILVSINTEVEENTLGNGTSDYFAINSIESNCESSGDNSNKSGEVVFLDDHSNELENMEIEQDVLNKSEILSNQKETIVTVDTVLDIDKNKCSQMEANIDEMPTDDLTINSIELNSESPGENSQKSCEVVFVEDHSNDLIENMDVDHDTNAVSEIKTLENKENNITSSSTVIS